MTQYLKHISWLFQGRHLLVPVDHREFLIRKSPPPKPTKGWHSVLLFDSKPSTSIKAKRILQNCRHSGLSRFLPPAPPLPPCINRTLLSGTWQLASLHQRVKEVPSPLCKLIIPHFTSINPRVTLRTTPGLSMEAKLDWVGGG